MPAVRLATAAALPAYTADANGITFDANGAQTVDGQATVENTDVLSKDEGSGTSVYNRIFTVQTVGDASTQERWLYRQNVAYKIGYPVAVGLGKANAGKFFQVATDEAITPGTTAITWQPSASSGGGGGTAATTTFTPAGDIAAINVQAALEELDTEKATTGSVTAAIATAEAYADSGDATRMPKNFGSDASGDLIVRGASAYGRFGIGSTGRFLHVLDATTGTFQYVNVAVLPRIDAVTASGLPAYSVSGGGTTLVGNANGAFPTVDTVTAAPNQTYLLKNGASAVDNGVYQLTTLGDGSTPWVLTRLSRLTVGASASSMFAIIRGGSQAGYIYYCSSASGSDIVGTNSLTWALAKTQLTTEQDVLHVHLAGAETITGDKTLTGRLIYKYATSATNYTMVAGDDIIGITNTSSARTVTLLGGEPAGTAVVVSDDSDGAATNNITITAASGTVRGVNKVSTNGGRVSLISNGTDWRGAGG